MDLNGVRGGPRRSKPGKPCISSFFPSNIANPAVAVARSLTNTLSGIRPVDLPGFIAAELIGAVCGGGLAAWLLRQPEHATEIINIEAQR